MCFFKETHEDGRIDWGTFGAHTGSVDLDVVSFVEDEIIEGQY